MDNSPKYLYQIGQLQSKMMDLAYDEKFLRERDPNKREQYIKNIIALSSKSAEDYSKKINIKENIMKKTELKALLKIIVEEVVAAKKAKLSESKGLSGFKKSKDSTEHTEKVADSKTLTPTSEPKEKEEKTKMPKVKKPSAPKVGIKEEILQMIREEINEMSRTAGAVSPQYRKEIEPGKWVIMGHPNQAKYPDGTPTTAPKGPYVPKGISGTGRPTKSDADDGDEEGDDVAPETSVTSSKISVIFDGDSMGEIDMKKVKGPLLAYLKSFLSGELSLYNIDPSVQAKLDAYSDMYVDDKLPADAELNLQVVGDTVKAT